VAGGGREVALAEWLRLLIKNRGHYQCAECRHQASLTAGTISASTKLAPKTWFRAMYHMTQTKAISSLEHSPA
jgi:hypothetical protein